MEQVGSREMVPIGHTGPAPYGVRYRWVLTVTGKPIDGRERERFFVTAESRADWVDKRIGSIAVLDRIDPPEPDPGEIGPGVHRDTPSN